MLTDFLLFTDNEPLLSDKQKRLLGILRESKINLQTSTAIKED